MNSWIRLTIGIMLVFMLVNLIVKSITQVQKFLDLVKEPHDKSIICAFYLRVLGLFNDDSSLYCPLA
jgi:hypothetical protein